MEGLGFFLVWLGIIAAVVLAVHLDTRRVSRELAAFRRSLEGGAGDTELGLFGGLTDVRVRGRLDGRPVTLRFERRGSGKSKYHVAVYEVEVEHPVADFTAEDEGLLDGLWRWAGLSSSKPVAPGVKLTGGAARGGAAERLLQRGELLAVVRGLLALPGEQRGVSLRGRTLRMERRWSGSVTTAKDLLATFRALAKAAALCGRTPVEAPRVKVRPRGGAPTFAWTGGGAAALCPYCRDAVAADGEGCAACERCGTLHHAACLDEAGGCTVFGCRTREEAARARAE